MAIGASRTATLSEMFCPIIPNGTYTIEIDLDGWGSGGWTSIVQCEIDDGIQKTRLRSSDAYDDGTPFIRQFRCPQRYLTFENVSWNREGNPTIYWLRAGVTKWTDMRGQDGYISG